MSCLLVEEAELGFLLPWLRIVRLLLALRLATNPRHGWACYTGSPRVNYSYRSRVLPLVGARLRVREKKRSQRQIKGLGLFFSPREQERHEMSGDAKNATKECPDGFGRGNPNRNRGRLRHAIVLETFQDETALLAVSFIFAEPTSQTGTKATSTAGIARSLKLFMPLAVSNTWSIKDLREEETMLPSTSGHHRQGTPHQRRARLNTVNYAITTENKTDCSTTKRVPIPNDTSSKSSLGEMFLTPTSLAPIPTVQIYRPRTIGPGGCDIHRRTRYTTNILLYQVLL